MAVAGDRLGPYEILSGLGSGGMGDVFKARDPRLDRIVAIKVLSSALARDPDALARFEREAMSVARLSHPNILAIHEFGRDGDSAFVVTELVEGETLRARLVNGPLAARRAVGYGRQIARGIAAAHARGIVHRDLKPENVMIGRDDQVKILDFGLAKPLEASVGEETRMQTSAGTVLGTFAYMAPEQVRGIAVDHRADIFAFGAVLYEMLSGDRAFRGETAADTMTAVLTRDPPDLDLEKLSIPPSLERIVRRCLEKTPELRFQSADDLAFALETLSTTSSHSGAAIAADVRDASPRRGTALVALPWTIAAVAVVAAVGISFARRTPAGDGPWERFTAVTEAAGEETAPTLSPDGTMVAFAIRVNGSWDIYAQRVGGRNATPIVNDPQRDEGGPAYSPDGASIAFHESDLDGGIFVAGATGESVRRLTEQGFDPAWSPDGKYIAFTTEETRDPSSRTNVSTLFVIDANGGTPRQVVEGDAIQAAWSPSGARLVYWSNTAGQRDLFTVAVAGGARVPVTQDIAIDWSPVWSPDGRFVYFSSDRGGAMNLWRIAVDQASGAVRGQAEPVTNGVQALASLPRFSKTGARMAFRSRVKSINPVAIPFDPVTLHAGIPRVLDGSNNIRIPSDVSLDGTQIAYFNIGDRQEDLFVAPLGGPLRRLTDDGPRDRAPHFTRDGKAIVFYSTRGGRWEVWTMRTDGSGLRTLGALPAGSAYPLASPVDDTVLFSGAKSEDGTFLTDLSGRAPVAVPGTAVPGAGLSAMAFSPDGRRFVGLVGSPSGRNVGLGVYDLQSHAQTRISNDETYGVRWLPDNRRVIYFAKNGSELVVVDSVTRERTVVAVVLPAPSIDEVFTTSPDGKTIYYGALRSEADIWIAERREPK